MLFGSAGRGPATLKDHLERSPLYGDHWVLLDTLFSVLTAPYCKTRKRRNWYCHTCGLSSLVIPVRAMGLFVWKHSQFSESRMFIYLEGKNPTDPQEVRSMGTYFTHVTGIRCCTMLFFSSKHRNMRRWSVQAEFNSKSSSDSFFYLISDSGLFKFVICFI